MVFWKTAAKQSLFLAVYCILFLIHLDVFNEVSATKKYLSRNKIYKNAQTVLYEGRKHKFSKDFLHYCRYRRAMKNGLC